ncbi:unnamed protein product, partial [Gongylonema pulchrum]|uniref:Secreted protein n=1 Tax=Gongylonema pulchrum TaxID=637853 RepID=A0A183EZQ5_9BILA
MVLLLLLPSLGHRICGPFLCSKRAAAALPKLQCSLDRAVALCFAKAEKRRPAAGANQTLKLVIRPAPEDGWYVMKPN